MDGELVFGFATTGVALAVFLGWSWRELRRVNDVVQRREKQD